jgi:hypothetical protein
MLWGHCTLMRIRFARLPQKAAKPTDGIRIGALLGH